MIDFSLPNWKTRIAIFKDTKQEKQAVQEKQVFVSVSVDFEMFIRQLNGDIEQATGDLGL